MTEFVIEAAFTAEAAEDLDAVVAKTESTAIGTRRSFLRRNPAQGGTPEHP